MPVVGVTASLGAAGGTGAGVRWRAAGGFGAICRSGGFDVEGDGSSDITGSGVDGVGCGSAPRRAPTAVAQDRKGSFPRLGRGRGRRRFCSLCRVIDVGEGCGRRVIEVAVLLGPAV